MLSTFPRQYKVQMELMGWMMVLCDEQGCVRNSLQTLVVLGRSCDASEEVEALLWFLGHFVRVVRAGQIGGDVYSWKIEVLKYLHAISVVIEWRNVWAEQIKSDTEKFDAIYILVEKCREAT